MSTHEKLIKARLGMLALAEDLENISLALQPPANPPHHPRGIPAPRLLHCEEGLELL